MTYSKSKRLPAATNSCSPTRDAFSRSLEQRAALAPRRNALTDVFGVSGQLMLKALLEDKAEPVVLYPAVPQAKAAAARCMHVCRMFFCKAKPTAQIDEPLNV